MTFNVSGEPRSWPSPGTSLNECALIVVDMQRDFCCPGYYMDKAGYDINRLRRPIEPIRKVLIAARARGMQVIYTQHGASTNTTSNFSQSQLTTSMKGNPGWQIIEELTPESKDLIVEKTTSSAFCSGELHRILLEKKITHLAFCGNTLDVCVHSSIRSADDLKYKCLLLEDCCGSVNDGLHFWSVESIKIEDGVFGTVSNSVNFISALESCECFTINNHQ